MKQFVVTLMAFLLVGWFVPEATGQRVVSWKKSEVDRKECRRIRNNIFLSVGFTPIFGEVVHPYTTVFKSDGIEIEELKEFWGMQLIAGEIDLRYNVFNFRDYFSISPTVKPCISFVAGNTMRPFFFLPVGADFNLWNHSTFNNINNFGLTIGTGIQYVFSKVEDEYPYTTEPFKYHEYYGRILFKYRRYKHYEISQKVRNHYGYFGFQYAYSPEKITLTSGSVYTGANHSFKLILGTLLFY
ncbi:MAG: hypothetical protein ACHQF2_06310 [Flavobacteriales bacterium]